MLKSTTSAMPTNYIKGAITDFTAGVVARSSASMHGQKLVTYLAVVC